MKQAHEAVVELNEEIEELARDLMTRAGKDAKRSSRLDALAT